MEAQIRLSFIGDIWDFWVPVGLIIACVGLIFLWITSSLKAIMFWRKWYRVIIYDKMGTFLFPIHDNKYVARRPKDGRYHWKKMRRDYDLTPPSIPENPEISKEVLPDGGTREKAKANSGWMKWWRGRPVFEFLKNCPIPMNYQLVGRFDVKRRIVDKDGKEKWVDDVKEVDITYAYPPNQMLEATTNTNVTQRILDFSVREKWMIYIIVGLLAVVVLQMVLPYLTPYISSTKPVVTTTQPVVR